MYTKVPDDWLEIDEDEDMLESRAFYELMQEYRFSQLSPQQNVVDCFEDIKEFIRGYFNPCQEIERLREENEKLKACYVKLTNCERYGEEEVGIIGVYCPMDLLGEFDEALQEQENG